MLFSLGSKRSRRRIALVVLIAAATAVIGVGGGGNTSMAGGLFVTSTSGGSEMEALSGVVRDAEDGDRISGAVVTLYRVPGWSPAATPDEEGMRDKCQSHQSKQAGAPWTQPAPTSEGEVANPDDGSIDPAMSQEETNWMGQWGWHVASGCWYVTVSAPGFMDRTSPVVGVPAAVTDLDVELQAAGGNGGDEDEESPSPSPSPSPSESRSPTSTPSATPSSSPSPAGSPSPTPTDEPSEEPPSECDEENGDVCGTKGDDDVVIDASDDADGDGQVTVHVGAGDDDVCIDEGAGVEARVLGGSGNDTFEVGGCTGAARPAAANPIAFLMVAAAQPSTGAFFGGFGRDLMIGGRGADLLNGGAGVDRMRGAGGKDQLKSSKGKDVLKSGPGGDRVYGGADEDVLEGGPGPDKLYGDRGHDTCVGGSGNDVLYGCEAKQRNF